MAECAPQHLAKIKEVIVSSLDACTCVYMCSFLKLYCNIITVQDKDSHHLQPSLPLWRKSHCCKRNTCHYICMNWLFKGYS